MHKRPRWTFLKHEDSLQERSSEEHGSNNTSGGLGSSITLYHLYHRATELVQRCRGKPSESYSQIWLGFAKQQW